MNHHTHHRSVTQLHIISEPRDHAASTHLVCYDAYRSFGGPSGFSGSGYAVVDTDTGNVLYQHAWRNYCLEFQHEVETERAIEAEERRIAEDPTIPF